MFDPATLLSLSLRPLTPPPGKRIQSKQRAKFIIFINALFKYLEICSPDLVRQAKRVVMECTKRNRMGDPNFSPLKNAVVFNVRRCIGEMHWFRANCFFRAYVREQKLLRTQARSTLAKPPGPISKPETLLSTQWQLPLSELALELPTI
jgi:hypothetical protein